MKKIEKLNDHFTCPVEYWKDQKPPVIRARKISKREIAENEREARQFLKGKIIK